MATVGVGRVKRNFEKVFGRIEKDKTELAVFAISSQGAALAQTMTPMDWGNLSQSQYAPQITQRAGVTTGRVGYTAGYASAVHSAPGTLKGLPRPNNRGNYWDPSAEPRFLEKGFEQLKPAIPRILKGIYRV